MNAIVVRVSILRPCLALGAILGSQFVNVSLDRLVNLFKVYFGLHLAEIVAGVVRQVALSLLETTSAVDVSSDQPQSDRGCSPHISTFFFLPFFIHLFNSPMVSSDYFSNKNSSKNMIADFLG